MGPGTAPRNRMRFCSGSTRTTGKLSTVARTPPIRPGRWWPGHTREGSDEALGIEAKPTLLVVVAFDPVLTRAARNVPWLAVETPAHASVYQVLRHDRVVFEKAALLALQDTLARSASRAAAERPQPRARRGER